MMKRILLSLFSVLAVTFSSWAGLAIENLSANPTTLDISKSQEVTLTFKLTGAPVGMYMMYNGMTWSFYGNPELVGTNGEAISCTLQKGDNYNPNTDLGDFILTVPSTIKNGEYKLNIPENIFWVANSGFANNAWSGDVTITITGGTGGDNPNPEVNYFEDAYITPYGEKDGDSFTRVDGFWVSFPKLLGTNLMPEVKGMNSKLFITVTGNNVSINGLSCSISSGKDNNDVPGINVMIPQDDAITATGEYTINIGGLAITIDGNTNTEPITATFKVGEGGTTPDPEPGKVTYTVSPANGSVIGFGDTITVTFGGDITINSKLYEDVIKCNISGNKNEFVHYKFNGSNTISFEIPYWNVSNGESTVTVEFVKDAITCNDVNNDQITLEYTAKRADLNATITPANGSTIKEEDFPLEVKVAFDQNVQLFFGKSDAGKAELRKDGTKVGEYGLTLSGNSLSVELNRDEIADGEYTITIPAGIVMSSDHIYVNPEYVLNYTIGEPGSDPDHPTVDYTFSVSLDNEDPLGFGEEVWVAFSGDVEIVDASKIKCNITGPETLSVDYKFNDLNEFTFTLPKEVTPGDYTVVITFGEDALKCGGVLNQYITRTYNAKREYLNATITPADGSSLDAPFEVNVAFDQDVTLYFDFDTYESVPAGTAELKKDGVVVKTFDVEIVNKGIKVNVDGEFEKGSYTLTIPAAGVFSNDYVYTNPAYTLTYNIDGNVGVEGIFDSAADSYTVVDCAGRVVVRNGSVEATRNLDKGIYIVNGKKTVIR